MIRLVLALLAVLGAGCASADDPPATDTMIQPADAGTEAAPVDTGPPMCPAGKMGRGCYDSTGFRRLSKAGYLCDQWESGDGGIPAGCVYVDGAGRKVATVVSCDECQ